MQNTHAWRAHARRLAALLVAAMLVTAGGAAAKDALLKRGSKGTQVASVQRALGIPADGIFGRQTARAVRRFQRSRGLTVDGVVGPATLSALGISPTSSPPSGRKTLLARIAQCESGGNPRAVSPDGRYRGKYQFTRATWRALGGSGDPAKASEAEQDRLAALLLEREGTKPWPACGARG